VVRGHDGNLEQAVTGLCDGIGIASTETMNPEQADGRVNRQQDDPTAMHVNGSPGTKGRDFVHRARAMLSGLPSNLDAQMKRRPYATLGMAGAIGVGMGILLGSRILRSVLVSAVSLAVVELGRAYMRQGGSQVHGSGPARAIDPS
jgi:hypothetical protein